VLLLLNFLCVAVCLFVFFKACLPLFAALASHYLSVQLFAVDAQV